jgi:hypothetical protein
MVGKLLKRGAKVMVGKKSFGMCKLIKTGCENSSTKQVQITLIIFTQKQA